MKKTLSILLFLILSFISFSCFAANYAIELKNGAVFITDHYWEEGDSIKCFLFGGIAGFDKQHVHSITTTILETEKPFIGLETPRHKPTDFEEQEISIEDSDNTDRPDQDSPDADIPKNDVFISITEKNQFLDRRDDILKKIRNARNEIQTAKKQGIDAKKRQFEKEFVALNNEYRELFNEVVNANGGTPPLWWPAIWAKDTKF